MKLCLFVFLFSTALFAVESDEVIRKSDYAINTSYRGGEYLIYDCKGKYYTCVDDTSYDACKIKRKDSKDKNELKYACAPLKKFKDKEECLAYNYKAIEAVSVKRFCYPQ